MDHSRLRAALASVALALFWNGCGVIDNLNNPDDLSVRRFNATPAEVSRGSNVTLTWDVDGAETVEIDNGVGVVKDKGSVTVRIDATTNFVLRAKKGSSSAQSTIQVVVVGTSPSPSAS